MRMQDRAAPCTAPAIAVGLLIALADGSLAADRAAGIALTVQESAGVARRAEPVSGGVPLPRGQYRAGQAFALVREDGRAAPCQVSPLVVETDGTLRWVLLDFQDDVPAGGVNRYVLRAAASAAVTAQRLTATETPDGITVDTGAVRFTVPKTGPFALFRSVAAGGKPVVTGGGISYVQLTGRAGWDDAAAWQPRELKADPPEVLKLHYAGPMRVTIEAAGHFADDPLGAGYRAFITAWAGSSRVHVKHKLCNSNPEQYCAIPVARSRIVLELAGGTSQVLLGAGRAVEAGPEGWLHQGLTQRAGRGAAKAGAGRQGAGDAKELWAAGEKDRAAGWIARLGEAGVFACDRLFASAAPRRLGVEGSRLVLEGIAEPFAAAKDPRGRPVGAPFAAAGFWLFDCTHHSSEYLLDFAPPSEPAAMDALARASRNRLWALAPGEHYSACEAVGNGHFGTLADEADCYRKWGWKFTDAQLPKPPAAGGDDFVPREDNHYESEADSVEALVLMYLRTGDRRWFDQAEAWARYHMDIQTWRTDGWAWKDGAIWFPQGGPQGNRPVRKKWNFNWGPNWDKRKDSADCADLWLHCQSKSCYCHYYGAGVADWFCLTGDPDALAAAIDNVETKDSEYRRSRQFIPGKTPIGCIRGFGRGFEVMMRVLDADPGNRHVADLAHLCARTLWASPLMDERGFHSSSVGADGGMEAKAVTPNVKKRLDELGITYTLKGGKLDTLTDGKRTWPVQNYGGTWQHVYIQNGAEHYARRFGDEDMMDYTIGFAQMSARYMRSRKCHQTWYYTYFDVPTLGAVFDPWAFDHADTADGVGCVHSGWYTRHYPNAAARGYSWTGEKQLLEEAKLFWYYGSKRGYQTKAFTGGPDQIGRFAYHQPPKDDDALVTSRLFYEAARERRDAQPPAAVAGLRIRLLGGGKAEVRFTAPADAGGGKLARYQVKAATLPIVPYEEWDPAADLGKKRNWWRAANCAGEPAPAAPGTEEKFSISGVPEAAELYFAVRSFDDSGNRSAVSNLAKP